MNEMYGGKQPTVWMRAIRDTKYNGQPIKAGEVYLVHEDWVDTIQHAMKVAVRDEPPPRAVRAAPAASPAPVVPVTPPGPVTVEYPAVPVTPTKPVKTLKVKPVKPPKGQP